MVISLVILSLLFGCATLILLYCMIGMHRDFIEMEIRDKDHEDVVKDLQSEIQELSAEKCRLMEAAKAAKVRENSLTKELAEKEKQMTHLNNEITSFVNELQRMKHQPQHYAVVETTEGVGVYAYFPHDAWLFDSVCVREYTKELYGKAAKEHAETMMEMMSKVWRTSDDVKSWLEAQEWYDDFFQNLCNSFDGEYVERIVAGKLGRETIFKLPWSQTPEGYDVWQERNRLFNDWYTGCISQNN